MKKLVITGSSGFIGMNFIEHNLKLSHKKEKSIFDEFEVIELVDEDQLKNEKGHVWMLDYNAGFFREMFDIAYSKKFKVERVSKLDKISNIQDDVDSVTILNFASCSHVDESIDNPFKVFTNNARIVPDLLKAIPMDKVDTFYHIRTDEEYGQISRELSGVKSFEIGDPLQPKNPYSASKASQTLLLESLDNTFGLNVKYFVLANQFGKYQHYSKFIPAIVKSACEGKVMGLFGDGENKREWTFVEETVGVITDIIVNNHNKNMTENTLHISDPEGFMSNYDMIIHCIEILKSDHDLKLEFDFIEDRLGHDFSYKLKSSVNLKYDWYDAFSYTVKFFVDKYKR